MTEVPWRPARFFAGIIIAGDPVFTYTVEPGELAIVTAIMGSAISDGTTVALQVTAAGVPIFDIDVTSAFAVPLQPSIPLYALVSAGDLITVSYGPATAGVSQAAVTVSGICYGLGSFPGS